MLCRWIKYSALKSPCGPAQRYDSHLLGRCVVMTSARKSSMNIFSVIVIGERHGIYSKFVTASSFWIRANAVIRSFTVCAIDSFVK